MRYMLQGIKQHYFVLAQINLIFFSEFLDFPKHGAVMTF
jgi:hypothetical protein